MSSDNETTGLLTRTTQPLYMFESTMIHRRQRRVRQFQCCVCAILLCAVVVLLVFAMSYGISQDITRDHSNSSNDSIFLVQSTWPNADAKGDTSCFDNYQWQRAIEIGTTFLHELDEKEKTAPTLDTDSPSYRHQRSFIKSNQTRLLSKIQYVRESAQKYLLRNNASMHVPCTNQSITKPNEKGRAKCHRFYKYRSYDGSCNNLKHPLEYGVAFTSFRRVLPPDYADGISQPRVGKDGNPLPSAREVSVTIHRPIYRYDDKFTVMLAVWGQFLDHDLTATAITQGRGGRAISCCQDDPYPECFPVKINSNDPYYGAHNITCLEFIRSAASGAGFGPRQQINQVSGYLDGSVVYGAHENITNMLREFEGGKLKMHTAADNRTLLPISTDLDDGCNHEEQNKLGRYCFLSGDQRANENLHLTSMHLLWARQHNNIADNLQDVNPHWNDERLFQETRKILAAQMQHITYNEFLKILFGPKLMNHSGLFPTKDEYYKGYSRSVDPSMANNFAAASFRFGHTLIPALIKFLDNNYSNPEYVQFHKMLFNPYKLYQKDGLDATLRGAMNVSIEASDTYFNPEVKSHLFERENASNATLCGLDLVSLNIQRGRDHGLPGYTRWREHCGLRCPQNFSELAADIDDDSLARIQLIYRHVDDIDLYTGAISEKPLDGGILGPTFTCLLTDQFMRLKKGDRMWYENPEAFSKEQLDQIRATTLAHIICDNSDDLDYVQPYVMERVGEGNEYRPCIDMPRPDLAKWKDADLPRVRLSDNSISVKSSSLSLN